LEFMRCKSKTIVTY